MLLYLLGGSFVPGASVISSVKLGLLQLSVLCKYNGLLKWSIGTKKGENHFGRNSPTSAAFGPAKESSFRGSIGMLFQCLFWSGTNEFFENKGWRLFQNLKAGDLISNHLFYLHLDPIPDFVLTWKTYASELLSIETTWTSSTAVSSRAPGLHRKIRNCSFWFMLYWKKLLLTWHLTYCVNYGNFPQRLTQRGKKRSNYLIF